MSVVQTHSKRVVLGILLSALIVGVMLTIGQVPLAVSQPVTIPAKMVKGCDSDGWREPSMGGRSRGDRSIERAADHHADAPEYFGEVGVRESHDQRQRNRVCASSGAIRPRTIRPSVPRISGIRRRSCSRSTRLARHHSSAWVSQAAPPTFGGGTPSGRRISAKIAQVSGMLTTNTQAFSGTIISKSRRAG